MVDGSLPMDVHNKLIKPFTDWSHPLGTDRLGVDLLSYMIYGARTSVILCVCCTILSTLVSLVIGVLSAVFGGWFDLIVQRIVDAFGCIPQMLLLLLMMSLMGNGIPQMIIALSIPSGIGGSRMVRSSALSVKDSGYCNNSDLLGGNAIWKAVKHVVPNIMPLIIISAAGSLGGVVMMEASMNFLGYGVSPGTPSWGALITGQGRDLLFKAPWLCFVPGIAISLLTFSSSMFGDAIRDLLDPRLKGGVGSYNSKKLTKVLAKLKAKDEFEEDIA
jgi:peptide/nickel transport system permease protein